MSHPRTPRDVYRALQRRARSEGRGTQELFEFYLLERFLYRLSASPYRDRFVHTVEARGLRRALEQTAIHRGTELMPLSEALDTLPIARQRDWRAFLDRSGFLAMPVGFEKAVGEVASFVDPVLRDDPDLIRWNPSAGEWERRR